MRLSYPFVLMVLFLNSCSNTDSDIETSKFMANEFPQKWKLVKMAGSMAGSETTGADMTWQENYIFKSDGSFVKTRTVNGESNSAKGIYNFHEEQQAFVLDYDTSSSLIENCTTANNEYLYLDEDHHYLINSVQACDGPGLYYEIK